MAEWHLAWSRVAFEAALVWGTAACSGPVGGAALHPPRQGVIDASTGRSDASAEIPDASVEIFVLPGHDGGCADAGGAIVDETIVQGRVPACGQAYAHPNVCCSAGPTASTVCVEDLEVPFAPCGCGALTFPDPRTCCSLESGRDCTPSSAVASSGGAGLDGCHYPCGAGGYPPGLLAGLISPGQSSPACTDIPSGILDGGEVVPLGLCEYCCVNNPSTPTSAPSYGCFGTPAHFGCAACPDGWQPVGGVPDLCCRYAANGSVECYSQAVVINDNGL
jgi:hypothetical protein